MTRDQGFHFRFFMHVLYERSRIQFSHDQIHYTVHMYGLVLEGVLKGDARKFMWSKIKTHRH